MPDWTIGRDDWGNEDPNTDFNDWYARKGQYNPAAAKHNPGWKTPSAKRPKKSIAAQIDEAAKAISGGGAAPVAPTRSEGVKTTVTKKRPGSPENGIMGSPNLGAVSGLQSFGMAMDAQHGAGSAAKYLAAMGINPTVNGQSVLYDPRNAGMDPTAQDRAWLALTGGKGGLGGPQQTQANPFANTTVNRGAASSLEGMRNNGAVGGGAIGDLSSQIDQTYSSLMANPTGFTPQQQQMLRNRASEPIAGQQADNMEATRNDAIRRGAAVDDADIRDQLNRVSAQGAKDQGEASFDVDRALADLARTTKLSAAGGASQRENQKAQLQMLLAQLEQENNPLESGLSFALGG